MVRPLPGGRRPQGCVSSCISREKQDAHLSTWRPSESHDQRSQPLSDRSHQEYSQPPVAGRRHLRQTGNLPRSSIGSSRRKCLHVRRTSSVVPLSSPSSHHHPRTQDGAARPGQIFNRLMNKTKEAQNRQSRRKCRHFTEKPLLGDQDRRKAHKLVPQPDHPEESAPTSDGPSVRPHHHPRTQDGATITIQILDREMNKTNETPQVVSGHRSSRHMCVGQPSPERRSSGSAPGTWQARHCWRRKEVDGTHGVVLWGKRGQVGNDSEVVRAVSLRGHAVEGHQREQAGNFLPRSSQRSEQLKFHLSRPRRRSERGLTTQTSQTSHVQTLPSFDSGCLPSPWLLCYWWG